MSTHSKYVHVSTWVSVCMSHQSDLGYYSQPIKLPLVKVKHACKDFISIFIGHLWLFTNRNRYSCFGLILKLPMLRLQWLNPGRCRCVLKELQTVPFMFAQNCSLREKIIWRTYIHTKKCSYQSQLKLLKENAHQFVTTNTRHNSVFYLLRHFLALQLCRLVIPQKKNSTLYPILLVEAYF